MAPARRSRRPRTTLLVLVVASVVLITLDTRGSLHSVTSGLRTVAADAFAPVRRGVDAVTRPVGSFLAGAVHYGAVREQNQELAEANARLQVQSARAEDDAQALQQLSALLRLPFIGSLQSVPAQVTNYGTSNFAATVDIDKGRDDGVQVGMPVVGGDSATSGGLVGEVVAASHTTATVRLLTDGQSAVGVRFGPAGTLAIVAGGGWGRPLSADLIPNETALTPGEVFVTSGISGADEPAGIPVARVVSAVSGASSSQETVVLQPVADLAHLRYVAVVLYGPG